MVVIGGLLLWCAALIAYRIHLIPLASDKLPLWLAWNLFLAAIPLFCSFVVRAAYRRQRPLAGTLFFCFWLLFLPNAPYILTDLIHLARRPDVPLWYDLAMLVACSGTGLMLGYFSLTDVQGVIDRKFGERAGWTVACGALALSGFGVYLGRFLRWNSWNAVTNPLQLARSMIGIFIHPGNHPPPIPVTFVFGVTLILGYLTLRVVALPRPTEP